MIKIILLIIIGYNQLTGQLFEDITDQSGTAVYRPQYSFFGAGATMADFNQDGYIDVFVNILSALFLGIPFPDFSPII